MKFNDPEMQEIFESFVVETQELLENLSQDLMLLESQADDQALLNRIFRSIHTIKGTSGFMGFDDITSITHHGEDVLNKLRRSELVVSPPIIDTLLEVHDWVRLLLQKIMDGDASQTDYAFTIRKLSVLSDPNAEVHRTGVFDFQQSSETDPWHSQEEAESLVESAPLSQEVADMSVYSSILANPAFGAGTGDFTEEELALIQSAFAEINQAFASGGHSTEQPSAQNGEPATTDAAATVLVGSDSTDGATDHAVGKVSVETAEPEIDLSELESMVLQALGGTTEMSSEPFAPVEQKVTHADASGTSAANISAEKPARGEKVVTGSATAPSPAANTPSVEAERGKADDARNQKPTTTQDTTIRVDVTRVESLMDLSGELVLGRNRLAQIAENFQKQFELTPLVQDLVDTTASVDFITSEIQQAVMKMRMVPIGKLYQKAPRIVRDLAKEFGKEIELVLKGEETEIDRGIIEELNDPLVHMIRNSCDHGIESPEERERSGKPRKGRITLDAEQEGNMIVLYIQDDGKGMDPEKLKLKALEKGLISSERAQTMSNREAFQIIFLPGFSTAAKVSAVSGRGVGMDVVRTNIQKLKGLVEIESEVGVGTRFVIKLPLTLAIIQGLIVGVEHETYALPLSSVVEVVAATSENVSTINQREVIRIRQQVLPLLRLDEILGVHRNGSPNKNKYVVVLGLAHHRIGLVVDRLLGQQEIVIKTLGTYLGQIRGLSGSTILGDGKVIMILDVSELVQLAFGGNIKETIG